LNQLAPFLSLQACEQFEIAFFNGVENRYLMHADSGLNKENDTGVKVTMMYIIGRGGVELKIEGAK
jgi:hypothetical protein